MIDAQLREFLTGPVMQVLCAVDADGQPFIARGAGVWLPPGEDVLELLLSRWQFPVATAILAERPRAAVTFMRPLDYVSYQFKGSARLRAPDARDMAVSAKYIEDTYLLLTGLGLPTTSTAAWFTNRDAVVASIRVSEIYLQTPGTTAGQLWRGGAA